MPKNYDAYVRDDLIAEIVALEKQLKEKRDEKVIKATEKEREELQKWQQEIADFIAKERNEIGIATINEACKLLDQSPAIRQEMLLSYSNMFFDRQASGAWDVNYYMGKLAEALKNAPKAEIKAVPIEKKKSIVGKWFY